MNYAFWNPLHAEMLQEGNSEISFALSGYPFLYILDKECQTSVWKQMLMHASHSIKMCLLYVQTIVISL